MDNEMTMQCDSCESADPGRAAFLQFLEVLRFLRRSLLSVLIIAAGIAILLGEAWIIERSPLFAAKDPTVQHASDRGAALETDELPVAVLH